MLKHIHKKTFKKSLIITSSALGSASVALGFTLFAIHSNENISNSNVYGNLLESENLFKLYGPYINSSAKDKNEVINAYNQAKESWKNNNDNLQEKLSQLDKAQQTVFNFYINNLSKLTFSPQETKDFWTKVLNNQEARIRELDLKNQLTQLKEDHSVKFFEVINSASDAEKQKYLSMLSEEISKFVKSQNNILDPFIKLLETTANKVDTIPFKGLKKDVSTSLTPLYSRIISNSIHLNDIQIASQDTQKEVAKLDVILQNSQSEINEIQQYLKLINPYTENTAYNNTEKNNVKNFINSTQINLNIASTKADINQIRNSVVTFYQQISDEKKSLLEIKGVISDLNTYFDKFDLSLNFYKKTLAQAISKSLQIDNKKDLISTKAELFSVFYTLKFVNELINDFKSKLKQAQENKIISQKRAIILQSQADSIISKKVSIKDLANQLFSFYNKENTELNNLSYLNNELKLLQNQILEVKKLKFTSEDIQNQLSELYNQVIKTYSSDVTSTYLTTVKNKLNESLRLVFKTNLKQLIDQMDDKIKSLKNLNVNINESILLEAQNLNKIASPMIIDFDPVPTATLIEQIKKYNVKLQNLVNAYNQSDVEQFSEFADHYLKTVFSNNDDTYVPTENEQKRSNLYDEYKKRLDELRKLINSGNGNPDLVEKIEQLSAKLRNLTETGNNFRQLSHLDQSALDALAQIQSGNNSLALKPYTDKITQIHNSLSTLYQNPSVTNEQIQAVINNLNKTLKELNNANINSLLNAKVQELKTKIDQSYGNELSSPGAKVILKQYNQLLEDIKDPLAKQKSNLLIERGTKLSSITPLLFEAEANKKKLRNIIAEKVGAKYSFNKTSKAIENARSEIANIDNLIIELNDPKNIPNVVAFENAKDQLLARGNEILLAYEQDKIVKINQNIQNTGQKGSGSANTNYSFLLEKVNNFASVKQNELQLLQASSAANKLETLEPLALVSGELLKLYNDYNVGLTSAISQYIDSLLKSNDLNITNSPEQIEHKINVLKSAKAIVKGKKKFLDKYGALSDALNVDKWKIYQALNSDISTIQQKKNEVLYNDLTLEQIDLKTIELEIDFKEFETKKVSLLNAYNQALSTINAKISSLDTQSDKLKITHHSYGFDTYYQVAKTAYQNDKSESQKPNVDTRDILAYNTKLQIAFDKDLVLNKLKDIETFAQGFDSKTEEQYTKIKTQWNTFESDTKVLVAKNDLSLQEASHLVENVDLFFGLFSVQKDVADYITELQANPDRKDLQSLTIDNLKTSLDTNLALADNNYSDLQEKKRKLQAVYNKATNYKKIREDVAKLLDNNAQGPQGLVQRLDDELVLNYDNQVKLLLNAYVNSIKGQLKQTNDGQKFEEIQSGVELILSKSKLIADVAKAIGHASDILNSLVNGQSKAVLSYKESLNNFIAEARNRYFDAQNSLDNNLLNQIAFTTNKLVKTDNLITKIKELKNTINDGNFNFGSTNQSVKLPQLNGYLDSFESGAINLEYSQEAVEKIDNLTQKLESFKNVIDADVEVSNLANAFAANASEVSKVDLNSLLTILADSVPTQNNNTNSSLGKQTGNNYSVADLFDLNSSNPLSLENYNSLTNKLTREILQTKGEIELKHTYREETHNKINTLLTEQYTPLVHNDLKNKLNALLTELNNQNNSAITKSTDPDQSGDLNAVRVKVDIIENKLNALKELATKTYDLSNLANVFTSAESSFNQVKNNAVTMVNSAKEYFDNTDKMSLNGDNSLENITQKIVELTYKLQALTDYQSVLKQYNDANILTNTDKAVIKNKLDAFLREFSDPNISSATLLRKYFRKVNEVDPSEGASAKNSLIAYALENAINLRRVYHQALDYSALKDTSLDNNAVNSAFAQLNNTIAVADGPVSTLATDSNDEAHKIELFNAINSNIADLLTAKRNQLQEQLTSDTEVKTYIANNYTHFEKQNANDLYLSNFNSDAIDNLTDAVAKKDTLSYSEVNIALNKAKSVFNAQVFDLYDKGQNLVKNIQNLVNDYFNSFAATQEATRNGSGVSSTEYAPILELTNKINTALGSDFNNVDDYSTKINALIAVISTNYQNVISTFTNAIKESFKQKFNPKPTNALSSEKAGFYVKLIEKLDPLKLDINGKTVNLYKYNEIESLETQYDLFKNQVQRLEQLYGQISSQSDATTLANFANLVDSLNHNWLEFESDIKNALTNALNFNPLETVFDDIYANVSYSTISPYTNAVKSAFDAFKETVKQLINNLNTNPSNYDFTSLNQDSNNDDQAFNLLNKFTEYKDWIRETNNKNLLADQLDADPNEVNNLEPIIQGLDGAFNHKYKVIIAKNEVTRKKFIANFNAFIPSATGPNSNLVQIDNNDEFLEMFDQFAFTKKDVLHNSDLKSIFSPVNFKVYIKKYNDNGWFENVDSTQDEVDRQSLRAKLVYSYESSTSDIGPLQIEKDVVMTFKTVDTIRIADETTSIFVDENKNVGTATKIEVLDVDEAGWNIPQVASTSDQNYNSVKQDVINRMYNKMKAAIFDLDTNNSAIDTSSKIIQPNSTYYNSIHSSTDPNLQNVDYATETTNNVASTRYSAYVNKSNNNHDMYSFDIKNQDSIAMTYNLSLNIVEPDQYLRIIPFDIEKGFTFVQFAGGFLTGVAAPGRTYGDPNAPLYYEARMHQLVNPNDRRNSGWNFYGTTNSWYNLPNDKIPTLLNAILYKFNFDYDPVTRKVYIYNSFLQNVMYVVIVENIKSTIATYKDNTNFKDADKQFLNQLYDKYNAPNTRYIATPGELSRAYSIFSSLPNKMIDENGFLIESPSKSFGSIPIYPLSGGQKIVSRTNRNDPTTARLLPVRSNIFVTSNNEATLLKEQAYDTLYGAVINKFWFKLRKPNNQTP
ncbi:Uncharacterised protein [Mycoplasmopsis citelli]|uniref:Uncharacterized protein n=1 Tax=Mycoplasmopsis citelli TaxID=171281 RepID=A0A449B0X6_9BACT|nr:hypothetical protein [Mycoplasmopsis citelli]VEU74195.1 Uncharacterised protein [Mycoplasmopsis citelli]